MDSFLVGATSALWLGILTSISPCPLATNIAAISFIGKHVGSPRMIFLSGLLYMIGRIFSYTVLGIILIAGFISVFDVSDYPSGFMNKNTDLYRSSYYKDLQDFIDQNAEKFI